MAKFKTIDVTAKEWFDKINENSYFSARVIINCVTTKEQTFSLPFQYGYSDQYLQESMSVLKELKFIQSNVETEYQTLYGYCRDNNIILREVKHNNCKKSEVKKFGLLSK